MTKSKNLGLRLFIIFKVKIQMMLNYYNTLRRYKSSNL